MGRSSDSVSYQRIRFQIQEQLDGIRLRHTVKHGKTRLWFESRNIEARLCKAICDGNIQIESTNACYLSRNETISPIPMRTPMRTRHMDRIDDDRSVQIDSN